MVKIVCFILCDFYHNKRNFFKGPLQMNVKEHTIGKWTKNTNKHFIDIQMIVVQSH